MYMPIEKGETKLSQTCFQRARPSFNNLLNHNFEKFPITQRSITHDDGVVKLPIGIRPRCSQAVVLDGGISAMKVMKFQLVRICEDAGISVRGAHGVYGST